MFDRGHEHFPAQHRFSPDAHVETKSVNREVERGNPGTHVGSGFFYVQCGPPAAKARREHKRELSKIIRAIPFRFLSIGWYLI
jgi:hypothetical protein